MPGCLPLCRMPATWCGTLRSVLKPSAKVRRFFPRSSGTRSECLLPVGLRPGAFADLAPALGMKPLSSAGSHT